MTTRSVGKRAALASAASLRISLRGAKEPFNVGGARRFFRNAEKAGRPKQTAPLVTAATAAASGHHMKVPAQQAFMMGPRTLDSLEGNVVLAGPDLTNYSPDPKADASLLNTPYQRLNDGKAKSAAELEAIREEIIEGFHKTFSVFEKLHEMFTSTTAFYEKHERLRHPPIFYVGHTASFYVNKLHLGKYITERIDPELEMQMAVGVDEMSWDDWDSDSYVWPSGDEARADPARATAFLQKTWNFRRDVRLLMDSLMRTTPMEWPIKKDSFWWVVMMGIEHERIHLETSSVIHRQADLSVVQPIPAFKTCDRGCFHKNPESNAARSLPTNCLIPIEAGKTRLGRQWEGTKTYGWDNEFGKPKFVDVPAFAASKYLVSNKEYLDFVLEGGYSTQRYWTDEGWRWVSDMKPTAPGFWVVRDGDYFLRTLYEEVPMPWDWPVEVSNLEAAAFCRYLSEKTGKKLRLPMEDEYLRLRDSIPTDMQDSEHGPAWGKNAPGNINLAHWASPCPIDTFESPIGVCDVLGNVWQHSETHIDVLDGFQTHPLYDDFTTPTVGEHHSRILGGSWMSTGNSASRDSRYGFRRHFYQHAGFRYVETSREVTNSAFPYERDPALCTAFRFHFDEQPAASAAKDFHGRLASECAEVLGELGRPLGECRTMELGCGPGRSVLEMARLGAKEAHGGDRTAKSFQCTLHRLLPPGGKLRWVNCLEGELVAHREFESSELNLGEAASRASFFQMPDFAALDSNKFHDYDLVIFAQPGAVAAASSPLGALRATHKVLKPGGVLAVGTQYEWSAGGDLAASGAKSGYEVLERALSEWFEPISRPRDLEFCRQLTARKAETGTQQLTFWKRRAEPAAGAGAVGASYASGNTEGSLSAAERQGQSMYEDELTVGKYLDFHFGSGSSYPQTCAQRCIAAAQQLGVPLRRALEVGAGPGRAAVELAKAFNHVDGGDYSRQFAELGQSLLENGELRWRSLTDRTAGTTEDRCFSIDKSALKGGVTFRQVDAHNIPEDLSDYDLVCAFNLIDRLARPQDFLRSARRCLKEGGLLIISSPYSWAEEFTSKDNWLGGFKYGDNDGPTTYESLKEKLGEQGFEEALPPEDIQFKFAELGNGRMSQETHAQMTFWRLTGR